MGLQRHRERKESKKEERDPLLSVRRRPGSFIQLYVSLAFMITRAPRSQETTTQQGLPWLAEVSTLLHLWDLFRLLSKRGTSYYEGAVRHGHRVVRHKFLLNPSQRLTRACHLKKEEQKKRHTKNRFPVRARAAYPRSTA